jgi:hypothetical protein
MPVVINEFEVVAEPQPKKPGDDTSSAGQSRASTPVPTPHDIECIIRHQKERLARVRAC